MPSTPTPAEPKGRCPICKFHWDMIVLPGNEHNPNCPAREFVGTPNRPAAERIAQKLHTWALIADVVSVETIADIIEAELAVPASPVPLAPEGEAILARIRRRIESRDDSMALNSACGEYNCDCHYDLSYVLGLLDATLHSRSERAEVLEEAAKVADDERNIQHGWRINW